MHCVRNVTIPHVHDKELIFNNMLCYAYFHIKSFSLSLESSLKAKGGGSLSQQLAKIDPDFYEYLQENDSGLLEEMANGSDEGSLDDGEAELMQDDQSSSDDNDDDLGTVEPRPLHITSRKEVSQL